MYTPALADQTGEYVTAFHSPSHLPTYITLRLALGDGGRQLSISDGSDNSDLSLVTALHAAISEAMRNSLPLGTYSFRTEWLPAEQIVRLHTRKAPLKAKRRRPRLLQLRNAIRSEVSRWARKQVTTTPPVRRSSASAASAEMHVG